MFKISSKNWSGGLMTIGRAETRWSRKRHSIISLACRVELVGEKGQEV